MKNSYKAALLAALGLITASAAQAADTANTLYLGFTGLQSGSGTEIGSDIVINLGSASQYVPGTSFDISTDLGVLSTFNTALSSLISNNGNANLSVIGGKATFGQGDVFITQAQGVSVTATPPSTTLTAGPNLIPLSDWPTTVGSIAYLSSQDYFGQVKTGSASNFTGKTGVGVSPSVALDNSGDVLANLWEVTPTADINEGYFAFNQSSDTLTWNGSVVPEPTTYGLLASAGVLAFCLRGQFRRKQV